MTPTLVDDPLLAGLDNPLFVYLSSRCDHQHVRSYQQVSALRTLYGPLCQNEGIGFTALRRNVSEQLFTFWYESHWTEWVCQWMLPIKMAKHDSTISIIIHLFLSH